MSMRSATLTVSAFLFCLAGCSDTTTFTSTWKAPGAQVVSPVGKKVAAVFVSRDESQRRAGEDAMVAALTARGAQGIPVYTLLPGYHGGDPEAARAHLKDAGANGVVVMRVVGKEQQVTYTPGSPGYYGGFNRYWGYSWGAAYDPGYLRTDTLVSVETLVYSLDRGELLWASTSRTTNPKDLNTLVNTVADATAKEMVKQGLLAH
jgi:hypothetical protein